MILLSNPLKNDSLETTVSNFFFLEIEIFTTKIVNFKSLKKICRQLLSTMKSLNIKHFIMYVKNVISVNRFTPKKLPEKLFICL